MYETSGVMYARQDRERLNGFLRTRIAKESAPREYNSYLAFDLFIKNDTGSPESDNLYFQDTTIIQAIDENISEEKFEIELKEKNLKDSETVFKITEYILQNHMLNVHALINIFFL